MLATLKQLWELFVFKSKGVKSSISIYADMATKDMNWNYFQLRGCRENDLHVCTVKLRVNYTYFSFVVRIVECPYMYSLYSECVEEHILYIHRTCNSLPCTDQVSSVYLCEIREIFCDKIHITNSIYVMHVVSSTLSVINSEEPYPNQNPNTV